MPGVIVNTTAVSGPKSPPEQEIGQWLIAGLTERGPIDRPVKLAGMSDYINSFGGRASYAALYDAVKLFFDEGGEQVVVQRVVGEDATSGSLTLKDSANVNTLRIDALSVGPWSTDISIHVADGFVSGTFRVRVYYKGIIVEDFNSNTTLADFLAKAAVSSFIKVTNLGSATAAPGNQPARSVDDPVALSAGADDRASLVSSDYVAALDAFDEEYGSGAVSLPGLFMPVYEGVVAHCEKYHRIAIFAAPRGENKTALFGDAIVVRSEFAGVFAPWVNVSDGNSGVRTISPEGYVAAARSRAVKLEGVWRAPAGEIAVARSIVGLDQVFSPEDSNQLDSQNVNIIRQIGGTFRLYGWRSTSVDRVNYRFLSIRDLLNQIVVTAYSVLEKYVYRPIDAKGHLLSDVKEDVSGRVDLIAQAGGLYPLLDSNGTQIDPGYKVDTSSTVNTPESLATDTIVATLEVRPSPTAATVVLNIYKVGVQSAI